MRKQILIIGFAALLFSCSKSDEVKPLIPSQFVNKSFNYRDGFNNYTLSFISSNECKHSSVLFSGSIRVDFQQYTSSGAEGFITNTYDNCESHKITLNSSSLILTHDNGFKNKYTRLN